MVTGNVHSFCYVMFSMFPRADVQGVERKSWTHSGKERSLPVGTVGPGDIDWRMCRTVAVATGQVVHKTQSWSMCEGFGSKQIQWCGSSGSQRLWDAM